MAKPLKYIVKPAFVGCAFLLLSGCAAVVKAIYPLNEQAARAEAGAYRLDTNHTSVGFAVSHFGFSTFRGRFDTFEGSLDLDPENLETAALTVTIKTDSLHTGVPALDEKLLASSMFGAARYPAIRFTSERVERTGEETAMITGLLTIKDTNAPVTLTARFIGSGTNPLSGQETIGFQGEATLKRSDFGLNEWLPFVGDDVTLTIDVEFVGKD